MSLANGRQKLQRQWRSLDELAGTADFRAAVEREFGDGACEWTDGPSRRGFLKLMGASLALAGLGGCGWRKPNEQIVPYVDQPAGLVPGEPLYFATCMPRQGYGYGVVAKQREGRPIKVDGNPEHPATIGGSDVFMQASILQLYDPERARAVTAEGQEISYGEMLGTLGRMIERAGGPQALRVRVLIEPTGSPTQRAQLKRLQQVFPNTRVHVYTPLPESAVFAGTQQVFGRPLAPVYDFSAARRILALDANFLQDDPAALRYARQWAYQRRLAFKPFGPATARRTFDFKPPDLTADSMPRLYVVEGATTVTGALADHRLPLPGSHIGHFARLLTQTLTTGQLPAQTPPAWREYLVALAADLAAHHGSALVVPGVTQPAEVHALAQALNAHLGAVGTTVRYIDPVIDPYDAIGDLQQLTAALHGDAVDLLVILDGDPVFTAPADVPFAAALERFGRRAAPSDGNGADDRTLGAICLGLYPNQTSALCRWHVPLSHYLESWDDAVAYDGTASIIQPLVYPLYESKTAAELVADLAALGTQAASGDPPDFADAQQLVHDHWQDNLPHVTGPRDRAQRWQQALRSGIVPGTRRPLEAPSPQAGLDELAARIAPPPAVDDKHLEVGFRLDPCILDGRYATLGWLQELPRPLSKITWDNAAVISAATAVALGLAPADAPEKARGRQLAIRLGGRSLTMPVWVQPGQPDHCITVHLGHGTTRTANHEHAPGFDVYPLRPAAALWYATGAKAAAAAGSYPLAVTQNHQVLHGRDAARARNVDELDRPVPPTERSNRVSELVERDGQAVHLSLYPEYAYTGYKWAMAVDLSACIGCNACVIACQAENNIPVVGKAQVLAGREMQWMRIDTYYGSSATHSVAEAARNPQVHFQPMMCQQCENAPCEYVCPVEATTHSDEGINEMTYNRCVGTRYCQNNCPYKVRRFNFLQYNDLADRSLWPMRNPEVTVRMRGVMEKCTYCIQRIDRARIQAKIRWTENDAAGRPTVMRTPADTGLTRPPEPLPALDVMTACQQACPTEAITFGDLNDAASHVARLNYLHPWSKINYGVLVDLNTQPRTTYLERIRNLNMPLAKAEGRA